VTEVTLDFDHRGDVAVARLDGEIDSSNASELRLALVERLPCATSVLALDLSGITYLDSSGVELLFELGRSLSARRQTIRLVVPEDAPVRRVLELCAVDSVAPIDGDLEGALAAIAGPTD
jgi:anti-sigma B factor antagonist